MRMTASRNPIGNTNAVLLASQRAVGRAVGQRAVNLAFDLLHTFVCETSTGRKFECAVYEASGLIIIAQIFDDGAFHFLMIQKRGRGIADVYPRPKCQERVMGI